VAELSREVQRSAEAPPARYRQGPK
jgi:hypothetical protein